MCNSKILLLKYWKIPCILLVDVLNHSFSSHPESKHELYQPPHTGYNFTLLYILYKWFHTVKKYTQARLDTSEPNQYITHFLRSNGWEAEGTSLLRKHVGSTCIEGSNPSYSATIRKPVDYPTGFLFSVFVKTRITDRQTVKLDVYGTWKRLRAGWIAVETDY